MSTTHQSAHTLRIEKYIKKMATAELEEFSEEAKAKLTRLGYPVTQERREWADTPDSEHEKSDHHKHGHKRRRT